MSLNDIEATKNICCVKGEDAVDKMQLNIVQ